MDINIIAIGALIVLLAASTQALIGFGFGLVALPFLILIFGPKTAVGLCLMLAFCSLFALFFTLKKDTNWSLVKQLLKGAIAGLPLGLLVLYIIDVTLLKVFVSLMIVMISVINLTNYRLDLTKNQNHKKWKTAMGCVSGFLSGSVAISGPPIALLLDSLGFKKEEFRATSVSYFIIMHPSSFIPMLVMGTIPLETVKYVAVFLPFIVLGMLIGRKLFNRVSNKFFKKFILILLIIAASYSLLSSIL
jgi:uncharacterized membrane protein YfcA